ncbi:FkbM family methyltransferase [Phenylobacterium zucineum]|nr:FkbM family methyltransferase [Phenylobacterium zucineum]
MSVGGLVKQGIRRWRRRPPFRMLAAACEAYLQAWYNEEYFDFEKNGEAFALARFAAWADGRPVTIWDVGGHHGEWSQAAHERLPAAHVHSFEIIPEVAARIPPTPWRTVHALGLSEEAGAVDVHWSAVDDTCNSISPRTETPYFAAAPAQVVRCAVATGDEMAGRIAPPDLLKIDTEGHEASVLSGCQGLLASDRAPAMIQFEYGTTYIPSGSTLREIYRLLPGYEVGRLYPDHVAFKPYAYADDHFRLGNMVAVKPARLRALLA